MYILFSTHTLEKSLETFKEKTLAYTPKSDEMVLTAHRWFANKSSQCGVIVSILRFLGLVLLGEILVKLINPELLIFLFLSFCIFLQNDSIRYEQCSL